VHVRPVGFVHLGVLCVPILLFWNASPGQAPHEVCFKKNFSTMTGLWGLPGSKLQQSLIDLHEKNRSQYTRPYTLVAKAIHAIFHFLSHLFCPPPWLLSVHDSTHSCLTCIYTNIWIYLYIVTRVWSWDLPMSYLQIIDCTWLSGIGIYIHVLINLGLSKEMNQLNSFDTNIANKSFWTEGALENIMQ
jgi:hypothetical protein